MHISITRFAEVGKLVIIKYREELNEILSRVYHAMILRGLREK